MTSIQHKPANFAAHIESQRSKLLKTINVFIRNGDKYKSVDQKQRKRDKTQNPIKWSIISIQLIFNINFEIFNIYIEFRQYFYQEIRAHIYVISILQVNQRMSQS